MAIEGRRALDLLAADPGLAGITPHERVALAEITGNRFWLVQQVLWDTPEAQHYGAVERDFVEDVVERVDAAMSRLEGPTEALVIYHLGPAPPETGQVPGYLSGVVYRDIALELARPSDDVWQVLVPARSRILLVGAVLDSALLTPGEVLIPRGSRFILDSVSERGADGRLFSVELRFT
jgi:hypothetical protein